MAIQKKQLTMKKIVLIISILVFNMYVSFGATLPSESYSAAISQDDPVTITPSMEMGGRVSASNTAVLGDDVDCMDECLAIFEPCDGDPDCENALLPAYNACMDECGARSLPIGSGFFFLLLLSGGYAGVKLRRKRKEA